MWQDDMERARVYRVGARPYHRGNFVASSVSRQVDERLHTRGLSTSSNSSWTFSNGHAGAPKGRRSGVCGAVLLAAVFVVVAAVVCVGGLAFYMGAKRLQPTSANLVLDGNLRVTYGDQFKPDLLDASSQLFLEKADRYQQMISLVLQKSALQAALKEVAVMRFTNGSNLNVGFRVHLDRRKIPEGMNELDSVRRILSEEFASVKPVAFRNMQVDLHRLVHNKGEEELQFESAHLENDKKVEMKNGVLRKSPVGVVVNQTKPKTDLKPVKGTSVQMAELGETIKLKNEAKVTKAKEEVKSVEFKGSEDSPEVNVKQPVKKTSEEVTSSPLSSSSMKNTVANKPTKVYQSIYITSDNVRISNTSRSEGPVGSFKVSNPDLVDYQTAPPSTKSSTGDVIGSYKISQPETSLKSDSIFTNPTDNPGAAVIESTTVTKKTTVKERNTGQIVRATTWAPSVNGHARPPLKEVPDPVNVGYALAGSSLEDEPWRPIVPSTRLPRTTSTTTEPYADIYDSLILDDTKRLADEPEDSDTPITFSKKVYDENLKIVPEENKSGYKNTKLSKITEEIAKKYKDILKQQAPSLPETTTVTPLPPTTTQETPPTVVVNPFKDVDDSRASSVLSFGLPELPILQQFHHLDSLLKSFAGGTAAGGSPPKKNFETSSSPLPTTNVPVSKTSPTSTSPTTTFKDSPLVNFTSSTEGTRESTAQKSKKPAQVTKTPTFSEGPGEVSSTRFPIRRKGTVEVNSPATSVPPRKAAFTTPMTTSETVYVAVSTFTPGAKHQSRGDGPTEKVETSNFSPTVPLTAVKTTAETTTISTTESIKTHMTPASSTTKVEEAYMVKGEVEVLDQTSTDATTEASRLVTLLPVRSNVNMRTPLRPRPPVRRGRAQPHRFVDDEGGRRWVYYSSSRQTNPPEKLFIVTPEPVAKQSPSDLPIYNTIEHLLNTDHRERFSSSKNTSNIVQRIVQMMDNVAIASENSSSLIVKINSTVLRKAAVPEIMKDQSDVENPAVNPVISTKAVSSGGTNYKLNQAGIPILTKVLKKDDSPSKNSSELSRKEPMAPNKGVVSSNALNEGVSSHIHPTECKNNSVHCSNGICLPPGSRCNQLVDCPDASDEKNCTCAEHLKAQRLNRKLCDGVVDCWDFSDEHDCDWCKPEQYLCSNSRVCVDMEHVCDGAVHCPHGDDERSCVRVAPTIDSHSGDYHSSGFLMVRKHGVWGKLCVDEFDAVSRESQTGWQLSDLGRSVCRALTYRDFDKVDRVFSIPNEGRAMSENTTKPSEKFFELSFKGTSESQGRDATLSFHSSSCQGKQVAKVTCQQLECGLRPAVPSQWSRIVGGGNASPGAWPWQAALYREGEFQCGATLVSSTWLVSAGHCFYHNQEEWWVARLGALRTSSSLPSPHEQIRSVAQVVVHPQYVDSGFLNDIALLRLAEPVRLTDHVRPICLPAATAAVRDGAICTVVGWGQLFELGRVFPDTLQEVQVPVISSAECRKRTLFLPLYRVTDDMLCAGYERGGRDACLGDSGGPLMCQEKDGRWSLHGVTSNGYGCARSNRPGVYTKVTKYLPWIQARIQVENHNSTNRDRTDRCKGHRCPLGECLPRSRLCNGYVECSDGSDEKDCW